MDDALTVFLDDIGIILVDKFRKLSSNMYMCLIQLVDMVAKSLTSHLFGNINI